MTHARIRLVRGTAPGKPAARVQHPTGYMIKAYGMSNRWRRVYVNLERPEEHYIIGNGEILMVDMEAVKTWRP